MNEEQSHKRHRREMAEPVILVGRVHVAQFFGPMESDRREDDTKHD